MQVDHGRKAQAIQLPEAIVKTLSYLVQRRTRDLGISNFPRRHALQHTRQLSAGRITLELSALGIGRFAIDSCGNQTCAVQHGGLPQILYIDWMLWRDGVELSPCRETVLRKLRPR